ncbi:MAG: AI-2E family transporter [Actinomycetaceae bacterium]|nr:AI-2E family transporter [Arcanobacterium sp.]MDD7505202.1 AI-2E family transporter [Actinomycetaceae bacterium]
MVIDAAQRSKGAQLLLNLALLGAFLAGIFYIRDIFAPVFLAITLVLAFRPIGRFLMRHRVPAWIAATVTFTVLIVAFVGAVTIIVWSLTPVPQTLVHYSGSFQELINSTTSFLAQYRITANDLTNMLRGLNYNSLIAWAWGFVDSLRSIGGLIAVAVIALFFITLDTTTMDARSKIMQKKESGFLEALSGFERRTRHYWMISTVFGLIVAVFDVIALQFLGVPLVWTWGVWAFVTNYIPNIGFIIGVVPPMLMALLDQGWPALIWVGVVYSVINVVIQTFIQPKFTGDVVGLSPTITFFSLILWTAIVGLLGSILAVPLTLFFKAIFIDADPRTRWLDVFFVSEKDAAKRDADGWYDVEKPVAFGHVEFDNPLSSLSNLSVRSLPAQPDRKLKTITKLIPSAVRSANRRRFKHINKRSVPEESTGTSDS